MSRTELADFLRTRRARRTRPNGCTCSASPARAQCRRGILHAASGRTWHESREFREFWHRHPAPAPGHRRKTMLRPDVGALQLNCDVLPVHEEDQEIVLVTADPGSATADALAHLERRTTWDTPPGRWPPRPKTQP